MGGPSLHVLLTAIQGVPDELEAFANSLNDLKWQFSGEQNNVRVDQLPPANLPQGVQNHVAEESILLKQGEPVVVNLVEKSQGAPPLCACGSTMVWHTEEELDIEDICSLCGSEIVASAWRLSCHSVVPVHPMG